MAHKAPRTKAHAVKFTDADWEHIKMLAAKSGWTPAHYINFVVGFLASQDGYSWQGLERRGWPKGKKRKLTPTS